MLENQPSHTALATAYLRAAHQLLDKSPHLFEDPLALAVLGEGASKRILDAVDRYRSPEATALRSHVVVRSRFSEDKLAEAVKRGIDCYVIVGAGLDTFAFRQPTWSRSIKIVEIDHPNTQRFKRAILAKAGITIPENVTFIETDLSKESLLDALNRGQISSDRPTFFSWLGVTMYITGDAIDRVLCAMGTFAAGSEVVLTFMTPPNGAVRPSAEAAAKLASLAVAAGEPFISYLEPADVENKFRQAGFSTSYILSPEETKTRYFSKLDSNLPPPNRVSIAGAIR